ncbi:MAG: prepilin-type N-terminal cleavage/methylation domain-containing protein [Deltaproteobacteria bacterium]|nr:prepilin-type N-terminal cleavage/methylation domain-containing protein [Deltaproteobacteria bacterium]
MKMICKKERGEKGFTLVEVMIAVAILAFGILAVASMQTSSMYGNSTANRLTEGTSCAGNKMEELLTIPETDAQLSIGAHGPETVMSGVSRYEVDWEVIDSVDPSNPLEDAKFIIVTVTWRDKGHPKSTRLRCIRPGLS